MLARLSVLALVASREFQPLDAFSDSKNSHEKQRST